MKFNYKAKKGINGIIEGEIIAQNQEEAISKLEAQSLFPVSISPVAESAPKPVKTIKKFEFFPRVRPREIITFTQKLRTLIKAKVELLSSLKIIYEQTENAAFREMILAIYESTKEGKAFSESLLRFPKSFSPLFINTIKAGEASGRLDYALDQITEFLQREESLRSKIRVTLAYPALLLSVGLVSIFILIIFVIPKLRPIFEGMRDLPLITKIILKISAFSSKSWILLFLAFFAFVIMIYNRKNIPFFDSFLMKIRTNIPIVKRMIKNQELAHFSRSFALLLNSGVVALRALEIATLTVNDAKLKNDLKKVYKDVADGNSIANAMEMQTNLPKFFTKMIAVGEESGHIGDVLSEITQVYTEAVESDTALISSLLEPVLILGLGLILGTIVLSVLLPTFQVTSMVR